MVDEDDIQTSDYETPKDLEASLSVHHIGRNKILPNSPNHVENQPHWVFVPKEKQKILTSRGIIWTGESRIFLGKLEGCLELEWLKNWAESTETLNCYVYEAKKKTTDSNVGKTLNQ